MIAYQIVYFFFFRRCPLCARSLEHQATERSHSSTDPALIVSLASVVVELLGLGAVVVQLRL